MTQEQATQALHTVYKAAQQAPMTAAEHNVVLQQAQVLEELITEHFKKEDKNKRATKYH